MFSFHREDVIVRNPFFTGRRRSKTILRRSSLFLYSRKCHRSKSIFRRTSSFKIPFSLVSTFPLFVKMSSPKNHFPWGFFIFKTFVLTLAPLGGNQNSSENKDKREEGGKEGKKKLINYSTSILINDISVPKKYHAGERRREHQSFPTKTWQAQWAVEKVST